MDTQTKEPDNKPQETAVKSVGSVAKLSMGASQEPGEVEKLRSELHLHKVEEGRVKALARELKEREAEIERMRQENEELKKATRKSAVDYVDPKLRELVDQDILAANESMIKGSQEAILSEIDKRFTPIQQTLENERLARIRAEQASVDSQIEQMHPGFAKETNPGGKYAEQWEKFLNEDDPVTGMKNGQVLAGAYNGGRVNGVSQMINSFKSYAGISRSESMMGSAFPGKPNSYVQAPGETGKDNTIYTLEEYNKILADSRAAFTSGKQTAKERSAIIEKLTNAAREGRIMVNNKPPVGV